MHQSDLSAPEHPLRMAARLHAGAILSVCLGLLAVVSVYVAFRSFRLAMTETSALPFGDIYAFYYTYFPYLDGRYALEWLLWPHNEHVILIARLVLWVDTAWFGASGKFAIVAAFVVVFAISVALAYLTSPQHKWERIALALVFFGLGCSAIQLDNLSLPFQLPFFFVHAFALGALGAAWLGLQGRRRWYLVAFTCDFGAVFSLGAGLFLGGAFAAMAVWARRFDRWFASLLAFHLLLVLLYFFLASASPGLGFPSASTGRRLAYFLAFLGNFLVEWRQRVIPVGAAVAAVSAGLFAWLTWRSLFCKVRYGSESALAGFAAFVILEAAAVSMNRAHFGVDQALGLKYTTCTLLLVAALFGFFWRTLAHTMIRAAALSVLIAVFAIADSSDFIKVWRERNRAMDVILAEIKDGKIPPGAPAYLGIDPDVFAAAVAQLRERHLGPFRAAN